MSVEAMNAVYQMTAGSPSKKAVLVALANMADQDGACFPSIEYISNRTELSRRAVQNCIKQLVEQKILNIETRIGKTGQRSNRYVIDLSGVQQVHRGGAAGARGGAGDAPITIINSYVFRIGAEAEFDDWLSVLKKKKAAMTDNAWTRRLNKLKKFAEKGYDVREILAKSADRGWTDIYEPDERDGNSTNRRETAVQRSERLEREELDRLRHAI